MVGTEVEGRQRVEAPQTRPDDENDGGVDDNALRRFRDETNHSQRLPRDDGGENQQYDVFRECLSVGEFHRVAETAAILDGVGDGEPQRDERHHGHENECDSRNEPSLDGEKQEDSQAKFEGGKDD